VQAYIILTNPGSVNDIDLKVLSDLGVWLQLPLEQGGLGNVAQVVSPANLLARSQLISQDKQAALVVVTFTFRNSDTETFDAIEKHLQTIRPAGTTLELTGQPVIYAAQDKVVGDVVGKGVSPSLGISLGLVLLILGFVYRSPLAVLLPIISISGVVFLSLQVIDWGKYGGWLPTNSFTTEFVVIVLFGAGTNYCLFLLSRYREELQHGREPKEAITITLTAVGEAISSSAATVMAAMTVMGLAQSNLFRSIGPAVAIAVALMLLVGLTLVPALISLAGQSLFWPWKIKLPSETAQPKWLSYGLWSRIGRLIVRRPVPVLLGCILVLLPLAVLTTQVEPSYNDLRTLPADNPAVSGIERLQTHFGGGVEQITLVVYDPKQDLNTPENSAALTKMLEATRTLPEVREVGKIQVAESKRAAQVQLTLGIETSSLAARQTIDRLGTILHQTQASTPLAGSEVVLRGNSVSTRDAALIFSEDFGLILFWVSFIIYVILAVLVRSFTAPLYLLATIALSTATSVGLTYLVFHIIRGEEIHFTVPIFAFVFLVALGEDFNILLMSRIREETRKWGLRQGIARSIASTGGTLTSCGLIMAGTFSVFTTSALTILHQIGFSVMAGVLMDTFIVRSMLVPAIVRLLGRWNWVGIHGAAILPADQLETEGTSQALGAIPFK
jgi:RND superfamily putative drug exporter